MSNRRLFDVVSIPSPRRRRTIFRRAAALLLPFLLVTQALFQLTPVVLAADQVSVSLNNATSGPTYAGFNGNATNPNPQNLSSAGTTDWKIWGRTSDSLAGDDRRLGGAGISDLTDITPVEAPVIPRRALGTLPLGVGTGAFTQPFSHSWTNGTTSPTANAVRGGLQHNAPTDGSVGYGFSFTVPATTLVQRLTLWVSAHHGTGELVATVGTATQSNSGISGGQNFGGVYTVDFAGDGTEGQTLSVSYILSSRVEPTNTLDSDGFESTDANVVIYAAALSPVAGGTVSPPVLYQATPTGESEVLISGRLTGAPTTQYEITVKSSGVCLEGSLGGSPATLGTLTTTTDATGNSYFQDDLPNGSSLDVYVSAQVTGPGGATSSPSGCIVGGPDNDTWPRALTIGPGTVPGYIDDAGRARWYKVAIQPGSKIHVDLTNLPADYDLFLFKDIGQAFTALGTTDDLTRLSAEFAPSAFSPSAFSPSAFSPSAFSPSAFSPSAFSPSAFSPSAFSPSAFSPSAFSPSAFSPSAFSPSAFSADTYASAQIRSLITGSAAAGLAAETVVADTWTNTGYFYIRVSGKNGASSVDSPFTLGVSLDASVCDGVEPEPADAFIAPAGNFKTLVLTDPDRMSASITGNSAADFTALQTQLTEFNARAEIVGAVEDLADHPRIQTLHLQADTHKSCMYAKNLVAYAIRDVVAAYRDANPALKYVVILGGDDAIPFFRYPDQALLGPESDFQAPVLPGTASDASLRSNYVLGQDAYGASIDLSLHASSFPIPDLPVGRLVETMAEASGIIGAYLETTGGTVATPTRSLVTGYDFLSDAATSVSADLAAGMGTGGQVNDIIASKDIAPGQLCDATHLLPNCSWDATALRNALVGPRNDLMFLAGHFSANNALAADFLTTVAATDLTVDMTNVIVFSAGCHSGYNIVDPDALAGGSVDWAQAFARKHATLIAGTGYQYGDTDFLEYSERIYAEFAHQLRVGSGPVSIGDALMRSKKIYLANTPDIRGLHEKALLESSIFGLPMLSVEFLSGRVPAPSPASIITSTTPFLTNPGQTLGLSSSDTTISSSLTPHNVVMKNLDGGTSTATYYSGSSGVVTNPGEPAIPLETRNVSVSDQVLRGVGFRGGAYSDQTLIPLTGAPADPDKQIRGIHRGFASPVFFPMRFATPNYFDALANGPTNLLVTPAQHRATNGIDGSAILRLYQNLDLRLFYSDYVGAAAASGAPTITGINAVVEGSDVTFSARAVGDPSAGIQQVWVTYTGHANAWTSVDLVQDAIDSTLWSKTMALPVALSGRAIEYVVQAANGVGLVALEDNVGRTFAIGRTGQIIAFAPLPGKTFGDPDFTVGAAASSGLAVSFAASGDCSITGATVHIPIAGSCTITASQAGNAEYFAAAEVSHTFAIARANQIITITAPSTKTFGSPDFAVTATSSVGLPVSLTAAGGCTVSGTTVHIFAVGSCTITGSQAGNANYSPATATATIQVIWPFTGFFSPVDNLPVVNMANAGSAIPVKFSLGGNHGLGILAGSPIAAKFTCGTGPTDVIEETSTASTSGLTYDAATGQYKYTWKTLKSYAGSCYQLKLTLVDGTTRAANFKFK